MSFEKWTALPNLISSIFETFNLEKPLIQYTLMVCLMAITIYYKPYKPNKDSYVFLANWSILISLFPMG